MLILKQFIRKTKGEWDNDVLDILPLDSIVTIPKHVTKPYASQDIGSSKPVLFLWFAENSPRTVPAQLPKILHEARDASDFEP